MSDTGVSPTATVPTSISVELAKELVRQGEVRLNAILDTALAADARANTLCGILGAAGVAICAAVLAEITSDHPVEVLVVPGLIVSIGFFIGAAISAFAGAPQSFRIAGGDPAALRKWAWSEGNWRSLAQLLDATAMRYADAIKADAQSLEKQAKRIHCALIVASGSLLIAAFVFLGLHRL